jgi:hypothetical protein
MIGDIEKSLQWREEREGKAETRWDPISGFEVWAY